MTPSRHSRYRRYAALVAALLAVVLPLGAGCAAGFQAQTDDVQGSSAGASAHLGNLKIANALLVEDPAGGRVSSVVATVVNDGEQSEQLTTIEVNGQAAGLPSGGSEVPSHGVLAIGSSDGEQVGVEGALAPGSFAAMTMTFRDAGSVTLQVLLLAAEGPYATITPPSSS